MCRLFMSLICSMIQFQVYSCFQCIFLICYIIIYEHIIINTVGLKKKKLNKNINENQYNKVSQHMILFMAVVFVVTDCIKTYADQPQH